MHSNKKRMTPLLAVLIAWSFSCFSAEEIIAAPYQAAVETFFLPRAKGIIYQRLTSLLDSARAQVLIAMYWLTDEIILRKIFDLKKHGIDIQIILDESTVDKAPYDIKQLISRFLSNKIVPVISPKEVEGIMHNKYVVIDNSTVWTGSANFTRTVLAPEGRYANDENIVIITAPEAAEQYSNEFELTKIGIFNLYIGMIATSDSQSLPSWFIPLCQQYYETYVSFNDVLNDLLQDFTVDQQAKLRSIFPIYQPTFAQQRDPRDEPTPKQKDFLSRRGIKSDMTRSEATELIGRIIGSERGGARYRPY